MYRILQKIWQLGKVGQGMALPAQKSLSNFCGTAAIRHVDAGSCNGCELEIQALGGPHYGLEQLGMGLTASPRHADILLVTGPVSRHMASALQATFEAMPAPKKVLALGDCACHGGVFAGSYAVLGAVDQVLPVHGRCPGCPPKPEAILQSLQELTCAAKP